jgi:hypothetical protein
MLLLHFLSLRFIVGGTNTQTFFHPTYQSLEMTPWPKPLHVTNGTGGVLPVADVIITTNSTSALLKRGIQRCLDAIKDSSPTSPIAGVAASLTSTPTTTLVTVVIVVGSDGEDLDDTTDESHTLHVGADGSVLVFRLDFELEDAVGSHAFVLLKALACIRPITFIAGGHALTG